jgi:diguanylate cyclase (GGDEF)-like protein/PAS domain S-box-containing protein
VRTLRHTALSWRGALLGVGVAAAAAYWLLPQTSTRELVLYDGVVLIATVASAIGWRQAPARERRVWLWTTAALALFLGGELLWWVYEILGRDPYPSVADASFLLGYVPLAIAAATLAFAADREPDRSSWLDAGIVSIAAGLVIFNQLMEPYLHDPTSSTVSKLVTIAYPLMDALVLGFVLQLVFSGHARTRAALMFTAGVGLMLAADFAFGWETLRETYASGSWIDFAYLLGYLAMGFAPLFGPIERNHMPVEMETGRGRLALVLIAVAVPPVVLLRELAHGNDARFGVLYIATCVSTVVMGLVAIRLWRLLGRARRMEAERGEQRLSALIHHSADAIFLLDRQGSILFASPAAVSLRGRSREDCLGTSLLDAFVGDTRQAMAGQLRNLAALPEGATLPLDGRIRVDDGPLISVEGTGRNLLSDENIGAVVVTLRDVTTRRQLEAQLERRAFHDELTGLPNRALFADRVAHALERSARRKVPGIAVAFVDLDDFKAVNDGMGHGAGDELLRGVATRIQNGLRPADTVARLGGDEFAVLLEDVMSDAQAEDVGDRILELLQLPIEVSGVSLAVPASVGIAHATHGCTVESLLRDADIAMYNAKAKGKGRAAMFDESLLDIAAQRLALKIELPDALSQGQFRLDYQPIVDVRSGTLRGFEALIRWQHPSRGLVPPSDFIHAAEDTGVIVGIGQWVLEEACAQATVWNERSDLPLSMSVNISPVQLHNQGFVDDLRHVLATTGLPPSLLVLELTESVLIREDRVRPILDELRMLGVGIAIDDFGTGYSSLSYLQEFPVTSIKVDQSFVADLASGKNDGLLTSILSMAKALQLSCVAEGVETQDQLEALDGMECQLAQGFHLGRPMTIDQIDRLVEEGPARQSTRTTNGNGRGPARPSEPVVRS